MAGTDSDSLEEVLPPMPQAPPPRWRVILKWAFKLALVAAIFGWLFYSGKLSLEKLREQARSWDLMLLVMALTVPSLAVCSLRFQMLLLLLNIRTRLADIVSLSMIGMLFDLVSIANGGDLVKAVYLSKITSQSGGKRNFGIILFSVLLDRIIGMFALFIFALIVCVAAWPQISSSAPLRGAVGIVVLVCAAGLLGFFVLVSEKLEQSALRKRLMHILPMHEKLEAIYAGFASLRHHKRVLVSLLGLSIFNHMFTCLSLLLLTRGIHFESELTHQPVIVEWVSCLTLLPLGLFLNTFGFAGGYGVGNAAFEYLFSSFLGVGGGAKLILAYQVSTTFFRLLGVPFLIFYKHKGANLDGDANVK